jgi:Tfp pilus assembly protein PilE
MLKDLEDVAIVIAILAVGAAATYWLYTRSQANTATAASAQASGNYYDQLNNQYEVEAMSSLAAIDGTASTDVVSSVSGSNTSASNSVSAGTTGTTTTTPN